MQALAQRQKSLKTPCDPFTLKYDPSTTCPKAGSPVKWQILQHLGEGKKKPAGKLSIVLGWGLHGRSRSA